MTRWSDLGRVVLAARLQAGYSDTRLWAEAVSRSTRMLLGLERGEHVGPKTLAQIEKVLGWPVGWSHRILAGEVTGPPPDQVTPQITEEPTMAELVLLIRELQQEVAGLRKEPLGS